MLTPVINEKIFCITFQKVFLLRFMPMLLKCPVIDQDGFYSPCLSMFSKVHVQH